MKRNGIALMPVLVLAMALSACQMLNDPAQDQHPGDKPHQGRVLTTDRTNYAPGQEVVLNLKNLYEETIGYNLCTSTLERSANGSWVTAEFENERACTMELRLLEPGKQATYRFRLDQRLQSGTYRFQTRLYDRNIMVISNSIQVQ